MSETTRPHVKDLDLDVKAMREIAGKGKLPIKKKPKSQISKKRQTELKQMIKANETMLPEDYADLDKI